MYQNAQWRAILAAITTDHPTGQIPPTETLRQYGTIQRLPRKTQRRLLDALDAVRQNRAANLATGVQQ